jgi:hypothetical protein
VGGQWVNQSENKHLFPFSPPSLSIIAKSQTEQFTAYAPRDSENKTQLAEEDQLSSSESEEDSIPGTPEPEQGNIIFFLNLSIIYQYNMQIYLQNFVQQSSTNLQ